MMKQSRKEKQMADRYMAQQDAKRNAPQKTDHMYKFDEWHRDIERNENAAREARMQQIYQEMQQQAAMAHDRYQTDMRKAAELVQAKDGQLAILAENMSKVTEECRALREGKVKLLEHIAGLEAALKMIGNTKQI